MACWRALGLGPHTENGHVLPLGSGEALGITPVFFFGNYSSIFLWRRAALVSVFQCPLGSDVLGGYNLLSESG